MARSVPASLQENMALVYAHIPTDLRAHLENLGVAPSMFLPPWLLTVFAADFPLSFAARLVDIMLADGWQRILINTAASLLTVAKDALMAARHMEAALNVLKVRAASTCLRRGSACFPCLRLRPGSAMTHRRMGGQVCWCARRPDCAADRQGAGAGPDARAAGVAAA